MAEYSTPEERTEMPSDRRMGQMRKEGTIHLSTEIVNVCSLIAGFLTLQYVASGIMERLEVVTRRSYELMGSKKLLSVSEMHTGFVNLTLYMAPELLILLFIIASVATLATMLQTKWNIRERKLKFDFSWLNPISGIKRIVSVSGAVNLGKAIIKLCLILPIGYFSLKGMSPDFLMLVHMELPAILTITATAMNNIFWKIIYILIPLAIFDYAYGKYQWLKNAKMTRDEVKDERKSVEGDESTRRRIMAKGLQRIQQRLMQSVPKADVVVTNPTHYSVALQYDRETMGAPIVVAKGADFLAFRIREIAKQHGVPVLERKALARALYGSTEVGSEIPRELFRAAAEVLAYVYRMRGRFKKRAGGR